MNAIGLVQLECGAAAVLRQLSSENRGTGSFILIDPVTNATVAAGMITGAAHDGRALQNRAPASASARSRRENASRAGHIAAR